LFPAKPRDKTFAELTTVLKAHFEPKPVVITKQFYFQQWQQGVNETISEYMAELRHLATMCEFNDYLDQALRDRLVCGLCHEPIQKRLLTKSKLTLTKAIEIAQSLEAAEQNSQQTKEPLQDILKITRK